MPVRLGELFMEAGAAAGLDVTGVLNVVHGDKVAVDAILNNPEIRAVSFVGFFASVAFLPGDWARHEGRLIIAAVVGLGILGAE